MIVVMTRDQAGFSLVSETAFEADVLMRLDGVQYYGKLVREPLYKMHFRDEHKQMQLTFCDWKPCSMKESD